MSKQDRQGVRTPADIERKYDLGQDYSKIANIATDAKKTADRAINAVDELSKNVDERFEDLDFSKDLDPDNLIEAVPPEKGGTGATALTGYRGLLGKLFPTSVSSGSIPLLGSGWENNGYISASGLRTLIGAFPTTGGTLTDNVTINKTATPTLYLKSASGQTRLTKNASDTVDYGAQLIDYDKDGNRVTLVIRGSYYNSPNLIARLVRLSADGTVNATHEIIHTGNLDQYVSGGGTATAMSVEQIRAICT